MAILNPLRTNNPLILNCFLHSSINLYFFKRQIWNNGPTNIYQMDIILKDIYLVYMNTTTILIKTDPRLKIKAQKIAEKMGLSLTSVINHYLKYFARTQKITFSTDDEIPNARTAKLLKQSEEDIKAGRVIRFETPTDTLAHLDKMIERERSKTQTNS